MANILTCYYRPKHGGFCKRLFRTIEALLADGHTVHYLSVEPFPIEHVRCNFHRFPWPTGKTDTLFFWSVFYLFSPLLLAGLSLHHGITHAFGFSPVYAALLKPACRIKHIRLACFLRGDIIFAHRAKVRPASIVSLDKLLERSALDSNHIVSISQPLLKTILRRHPKTVPASLCVLPNELPIKEPFSNLFSSGLNKPKNTLHLAFAGVLEPTKNIDFLFDLMKLLPSQKYRLFLFGSGPLKESLHRRILDEGLNKSIQLKGWVKSETIWPQVDLLLAPSLSEGMPNAVMEAIAHQVPVLASDIPAHREILPEDQLISLDCPGKWRQTLECIIDIPEQILLRMRDAQLRCAEKFRFDWDARVVEAIIGGN